ncbi:MAG TPA: chain length determinant protein EpsF [Rubrivivax sp.]|nr:chain length determinant protein EpsF [Rubrivivax sp.]
MTFAQLMSILRARWKAALALLLLVSVGTWAVSMMLPKQYKAVASVVVDFKPDPVSAVLYGGMVSPAVMATQADILQSERVALRVVRNLRLSENPQVRKQWVDETGGQGNIESWLGTLFQRQMDVIPSRESSVISVAYKAPDPRFAAALANAFVRAYIDTSLELRVDPAKQYSSFFEGRTKEARDALEAAQNKLSAYQKAKGIIATDERLDIESTRLNELSSQLTALQAISAESSSRQAQAQGAQGDRLSEVLNNPLLAGIKADIVRNEGRLQELSTRYGDNHPLVMEARASLTDLRARLQTETRRVTGSVSINNSINRQREAEIRRSLDAQRTRVLQMKAVRDEGVLLQRDVENAQRAFDAVQQRFMQTNLESQTTQSNINQLTQAEPPLAPATPRVTLNTVVATLIGSLLAIGLALVLELRDRRVRSLEDLVVTLGLPVLATMPGPRSRFALGRKRDSLMQQRLNAPQAT